MTREIRKWCHHNPRYRYAFTSNSKNFITIPKYALPEFRSLIRSLIFQRTCLSNFVSLNDQYWYTYWYIYWYTYWYTYLLISVLFRGCPCWTGRYPQYWLCMETVLHMFQLLERTLLQDSYSLRWYMYCRWVGIHICHCLLLPRLVLHSILQAFGSQLRMLQESLHPVYQLLRGALLCSMWSALPSIQEIKQTVSMVINVYIVLFQGRETLQNSYHLFNLITIDWAKCKTRSLTVQAMTINYQVEILPYSVIFIF